MQNISVVRNTEVGTFIATDAQYLETCGGHPTPIIRIEPGNYDTKMAVEPKTEHFYDDLPVKKGILKITSGRLYIGDPAAAFKSYSKWDAFLDGTDFMNKCPSGTVIIDTGGDGQGKISLALEKV